MRRKLGILILVSVTVLAGTQEAVRQFDGLRSSVNDLTRASLWSGLIVYAQPVADGKLPSPQIYYLMPRDTQQPASPAAQPEAVLADNNNNLNAAKPEAKNNHTEEAADASTNVLASAVVATSREVEDAAKSEFVLLPQHGGIVAAAAPKLEKARVYEEVARNEMVVRRFKMDADAVARIYVKEFNAAKLKAETDRFIASQEQIETLKLKALGDVERLHGQLENSRIELRVLRRASRPAQTESLKDVSSLTEEQETALPAMSGVACEKTINAQEGLAAEAPATIEAAVPAMPATAAVAPAPSVRSAGEPLAEAEVSPVITLMGHNWSLDCDTEPEFK